MKVLQRNWSHLGQYIIAFEGVYRSYSEAEIRLDHTTNTRTCIRRIQIKFCEMLHCLLVYYLDYNDVCWIMLYTYIYSIVYIYTYIVQA